MHEFINHKFKYAVIGASQNPEKYGHRVFKDLLEAGYSVYPVNPNAEELLGQKLFQNLKNIPDNIDVVIMVVPPPIAVEMLKQIKSLGINKVWFQPGSESNEAGEYCRTEGINFVSNACIMVKRRDNE